MSLPTESPSDNTAAVVFQQQPPAYFFNEKWFSISLSLTIPSMGFRDQIADSTIILQPQLMRYTNNDTYPLSNSEETRMEMYPQTITLPISSSSSAGKVVVAKARCKIKCPKSKQMVEQSFMLEFKQACSATSNNRIKVHPVKSEKMTIVDAKLEVSNIDWDKVSAKDVDDKVWYKDMGGKDNAMQITVTLIDQDGETIKNQKIPLRLDLYYDNEYKSRVMNQDILRLIGSKNPYIDPNTGKTVIQFRIEQVSKNHQNQDFLIKISDDRANHSRVQPGFTLPVTVRSKIKGSAKTSKVLQQQPLPSLSQQGYPSVFSHKRTISPTGMNSAQTRNAMRGVIEWTEEVINGLHQLKWNHIGYEQFPDGTYNRSHPLYQMQNPNETINKIMSMYELQTRENIRILIQSTDSISPSSNGPYGSSIRNPMLQTPSPPNSSSRPNRKRHHAGHDDDRRHQLQYTAELSQGNLATQQGMQVQNFMPRRPDVFNQQDHFLMTQQHPSQARFPFSVSAATDQNEEDHFIDAEYRQGEVQYVLARPFTHSGKNLGYPAYSLTKRLLGFYNKSIRDGGGGPQFVPMQNGELHSTEMEHAMKILDDAILQGDRRVLHLNHFQSLTDLVNEALSYERWQKNCSGESSNMVNVEIGLANESSPVPF